MAIQPTLARGPRLSAMPLPDRGNNALLEGGAAIVNAVAGNAELDRQVDRRIADIDHDIAMRQQREAENLAIANAGARSAQMQTRLSERIATLRTDPSIGPDAYPAAVKAAIDEETREFWNALPQSERVRTQFIAPMAQLAGSIEVREGGWAREQSAKLQGDSGQQVINVGAQAIQLDPRNAENFAAQMAASDAVIDGIDATPAARAAMRRLRDQAFRSAALSGLENAGDYQGMRALANDPGYMAVFDADFADRTLARADQSERAALLAQKAQVEAQRDQVSGELDTIEATIATGGIVDQGRIDAAAAAARAAGVPEARVIEFQGKGMTQAINRQFGPAADPTGALGRAEISRLNGIARQRPLNSEENMTYQRLIDVQGKRRMDDAALLKANLGKDPRSYLSVLGEVDQRPQAERFALAEAVRPGLGYFGLLRPGDRQDAMEGYFDLQANPDLIKAKGRTGGLVDPTPKAFRQHIGAMAGELPEDTIDRYGKVAASIYAHYLKDEGKTGWHPRLFAQAANIATGAKQGSDGVWRGGIGLVNGRHVWLPDWSSAASLTTMLARANYSNAVYANGQTVSRDDVLKNYSPVLVEGGGAGEPAAYIFVNAAGQSLKRKDGGDFRQVAMPRGGR